MKNIYDILEERGFIKQTVYKDDLYQLLGSTSVPFYIGFDPTADSLHVGHYLALMAMSHMQKAGHTPIVLIGGGTAMIGDPSGRTDMRSMITKETIEYNCEAFKKQMSRFFKFEGENAAIMVNNADWLLDLNYVEFIRDIGSNFSVNRMLTADCYKTRLEKGLTFLEFNYMLMQAYDFLVLFEKYGCSLQCGGDDQWSNILAGADLIRRKLSKPAYAMTFQLLTTSEGKKMGKTQSGAIWLNAEKTSPYDFYQYWRNVPDDTVENCMKLLTYMELDRIVEITRYKDERINKAKEILAYEITKIVHGEVIADEVEAKVKAAFSGDVDNMDTKKISTGICNIVDILVEVGACVSKSEARRLVQSSSVAIDDVKITDYDYIVPDEVLTNGFKLTKGKKFKLRIEISA